MRLGMIGLGRMGGNMAERIRAAGHTVVGYDANPEVTEVPTLEALRDALPAPRSVWVMVPAGLIPISNRIFSSNALRLQALRIWT